jgi:dolichol kinase
LIAGDVAATTVGERWGRHRVGAKSIEGTAAFFVAACAAGFAARALLSGPAPGAVVAGAWCAALVELLLPPFANEPSSEWGQVYLRGGEAEASL